MIRPRCPPLAHSPSVRQSRKPREPDNLPNVRWVCQPVGRTEITWSSPPSHPTQTALAPDDPQPSPSSRHPRDSNGTGRAPWAIRGTAILTVVSGIVGSIPRVYELLPTESRPAVTHRCRANAGTHIPPGDAQHAHDPQPVARTFGRWPDASRKEIRCLSSRSLDDLLVHELQRIYHAETQVLEVLPRMVRPPRSRRSQADTRSPSPASPGGRSAARAIIPAARRPGKRPDLDGMAGLLEEGGKILEEEAGLIR